MQSRITRMNGFLKSSFFNSLIYFNFIISICFIVLIAAQIMNRVSFPQNEAIEQNPLQQKVSEGTAHLVQWK